MMDLYSLFLYFANISKVVLCSVVKVPQIISLIKAKNVNGLSLSGTLLELTTFTIGLCYNVSRGYTLSSYLEYPLLVVQDMFLLILVLHYSKQWNLFWFAAFGAYLAVAYALTTSLFPSALIVTLMNLCTPISAASKLAHLKTMQATQNSESVSIFTWSIAIFNSVTRIVTTLDRGFDASLLINYSVSFILNLAIILLALKLRRPAIKKDKKGRR